MEIKSRKTNEIEYSSPKIIKFKGKKDYKSYRSWLESRLAMATRKGNLEAQIICQEMLNSYNHFHPRKTAQVPVDSWKGKSSFEIIRKLDSIIIVKYQKPQKGAEPKKIETVASKEQLEALVASLKTLGNQEAIKTRDIAREFSLRLELGHQTWNEFFADRHYHNLLCLMLGALDKLELIEYKGGITKILNKDISIQLIL